LSDGILYNQRIIARNPGKIHFNNIKLKFQLQNILT